MAWEISQVMGRWIQRQSFVGLIRCFCFLLRKIIWQLDTQLPDSSSTEFRQLNLC